MVVENITKVCPSPILCEAKTTFQRQAGATVWMGPDAFHVSAKVAAAWILSDFTDDPNSTPTAANFYCKLLLLISAAMKTMYTNVANITTAPIATGQCKCCGVSGFVICPFAYASCTVLYIHI
jgi:hypothetical protein